MKPYYIDIHSHKNNSIKSAQSISLINHEWNKPQPNSLYLCASIHPWDLPKNITLTKDFLLGALKSKKYVAVGEIGLDKKCHTPWSLQMDHFRATLNFTKEQSKSPIILHCVKSYSECINEIKKINHQSYFIFHDYHGSIQQTLDILKDDQFYISLGSILSRPQSKLTSYLKDLPLNKIFFETDDNEGSIEDIYKKFCDMTRRDIHEVKSICYNNFITLFPGFYFE